ncbi:MAG: type II toxin-antitoxin system Phd/YefM family antitoxin [Rhodospirillales bacterium]|nr:type II toxin-antitoxin system Phd/YefM family antitoxin [Rhodospirillales bacterium]
MGEFDAASLPGWGLGDAKAHLSKVVRLAASGRPQKVTVHGKDAVVVVSIDEFRSLQALSAAPGLHELLSSSPLNRLEFGRESVRSPVREVDL